MESGVPQSGPRSKQEFIEFAHTMRIFLADMAQAVDEYERAIESIPDSRWPIDTANYARTWHRTEYVKGLRGEASYLRDIAHSLASYGGTDHGSLD